MRGAHGRSLLTDHEDITLELECIEQAIKKTLFHLAMVISLFIYIGLDSGQVGILSVVFTC